jgi:hypothetical protein
MEPMLTMVPLPRSTMPVRDQADAGQDALDVDVDHRVPLGGVAFEGGGVHHDAGVVHQVFGRAELRFGIVDRSLEAWRIEDIDSPAECVGEIERFHRLQTAGEQQQRMSCGGKGLGGGGRRCRKRRR